MSLNPSNPMATRSPTTIWVELVFPRVLPGAKLPRLQKRRRGNALVRYRMAGQVFEHTHQPRMVPAFAAERGGGVEELLSRRRIGQ
jgi:hypothetical protein